MADPIVALLGEDLVGQGGASVKTKDAVANAKAVGIYFSAHWCPPCRQFTPMLAEQYTNELKALGMEIVFASSDRDEAAFTEYFNEMPWLAIPYNNKKVKEELSEKYQVRGIPTLVIVDRQTGQVNTKNGRAAIADPSRFPFKE